MSLVHDHSILYQVIEGKYKGRICGVRRYYFRDMDLNSSAEVVFADSDRNDFATIYAEHLVKIDPPGWPLIEKEYEYRQASTYGLEQWFAREKGNGSNLIRTDVFAQPRALKINDALATGETVEKMRTGYNDSVLIKLNRTGWVELAPRLPLALLGNRKPILPMGLIPNYKLVTGCIVAKKAISLEKDWASIYLDRENCCIEVPSCIPLALA